LISKSVKFLIVIIVILILAAGFAADNSFAGVDEQVLDRYPAAAPSPEEKAKQRDFFAEQAERFHLTGFVNVQQGYDNNTDLDPNRYKDGFLQGLQNAEVTYEAADDLDLKIGLDLFEAMYYNRNYNNILDVVPYLGFDYEVMPDLIWGGMVKYDYFSYPNEKENTFSGLVVSTYLRQYLLDNVYHEVGYEYLHRWYPDWKTSISYNDFRQSDNDRSDSINRLKYHMGVSLGRLVVRLANEFHWNSSSERYQNYYDYLTYRLKPSVMFFFTEKFYTDLNLVYRYNKYHDRKATDGTGKGVYENNYIFNATLYYDIAKNITLGLTYSYTENQSNDPYNKYSGSIFSGGVYYNF